MTKIAPDLPASIVLMASGTDIGFPAVLGFVLFLTDSLLDRLSGKPQLVVYPRCTVPTAPAGQSIDRFLHRYFKARVVSCIGFSADQCRIDDFQAFRS